ncbi:MAG: recombinase family protein [Oscillospiraceae bacterium]|nr:recombinase family protein [Oscillospiraceae bacterium]
MIYGYCRVSTKGQLDGNSIEEQTSSIKSRYADAQIITESYSGAKERPIFNDLLKQASTGAYNKLHSVLGNHPCRSVFL